MILCDVCETRIKTGYSKLSFTEEYYLLICPNCGFDNTYQTNPRERFTESIYDFIDENMLDFSDWDADLESLAERFGITQDRLSKLIEEHELFDNGFSIKRNNLDEL